VISSAILILLVRYISYSITLVPQQQFLQFHIRFLLTLDSLCQFFHLSFLPEFRICTLRHGGNFVLIFSICILSVSFNRVEYFSEYARICRPWKTAISLSFHYHFCFPFTPVLRYISTYNQISLFRSLFVCFCGFLGGFLWK
jgi:hypothetical protein